MSDLIPIDDVISVGRTGRVSSFDIVEAVLAGKCSPEDVMLTIDEHSLVVFRLDRLVEPSELDAFVRKLGTPYFPDFIPTERETCITRVVHSSDDRARAFGSGWHSDWSFEPEPPRYSLVHALEMPIGRGQTLWSDQRQALESLSPPVQAVLRASHGVHSARMSYGPDGTYARSSGERSFTVHTSDRAKTESIHPAVVTVDGREALYLNESYTTGLDGWREFESAGLLQFLFRWMTLDEFVTRLEWAPGMLACWDNRVLNHRVTDNYQGCRREILRATWQ